MPNPLEFILNAFSVYVISKNLDVLIFGGITIVFLYVVLKTIQNGFPQQGKDPERNRIVRFALQGLFVMFFMTFFYLIFHQQVQESLGAIRMRMDIQKTCLVCVVDNVSDCKRRSSRGRRRQTGICQAFARDGLFTLRDEKGHVSLRDRLSA